MTTTVEELVDVARKEHLMVQAAWALKRIEGEPVLTSAEDAEARKKELIERAELLSKAAVTLAEERAAMSARWNYA